MKESKKTKRYNLVLDKELYLDLQAIADRDKVAVIDVLRRFLKVGIYVDQVSHNPNSKVLVRENNADREIVFL